jgi:hypothetical protein
MLRRLRQGGITLPASLKAMAISAHNTATSGWTLLSVPMNTTGTASSTAQ